jgi:hypothetical protein
MKTRSKALYAYLLDTGVIHGTPEEIAMAKRSYRRLYKMRWKQGRIEKKEIRVEFTLKQFSSIKVRALEAGLTHTTYARNAILFAAEAKQPIPHKDMLLQILQLVSMAAIAAAKNTIPLNQLSTMLYQAESHLIQYLKQ